MRRVKGSHKVMCQVEGCENEARYPHAQLCGACYQSLRYHIRLGTAHVAQWISRLKRFNGRAGLVSGGFGARKRKAA